MCLKVQANSFSEPPLQYNQNQVSLTDEGCLWPLFNNMVVTGSFKTPFGTVTIGLSELHLRYRRFIFKKWKKWFLWAMATTQAVENHGERLELIFSIKDIYIYICSNLDLLTKSVAAAETPSLKISLVWSWRLSQSTWE